MYNTAKIKHFMIIGKPFRYLHVYYVMTYNILVAIADCVNVVDPSLLDSINVEEMACYGTSK